MVGGKYKNNYVLTISVLSLVFTNDILYYEFNLQGCLKSNLFISLRYPMQRDHNHAPKTIDFWIRKTKALLHQRITTDLFIKVDEVYENTITEIKNEIGTNLLGLTYFKLE